MKDIVALGELLIDFLPRGKSDQGSNLYEANPGGAPCNVLAAMARLSKKTAFIGKVGTDTFGIFLRETLQRLNIDAAGLVATPDYFTTLAFVTLDAQGNREFAFSRKNSADVMLTPDEVDPALIKSARIFHCGTLSLTHENCRAATLKALDAAKSGGVLISVDPNLREGLWGSLEEAAAAMRLALGYADIIKISDYELSFLYGEGDVVSGAKRALADFSPKILFATCGKEGAYLLKGDTVLYHPSFPVNTVDTTGAGDCFCGAVLAKLLDYDLDIDGMSEAHCREVLRFANAAASLATTKRGGITAMPAKREIENLLAEA